MLQTLVIAAALSLDSFALAIGISSSHKKSLNRFFFLAASIGIFHVLQIIVGFTIGQALKTVISNVDHWVSFLLLSFVGLKLMVNSSNASPTCPTLGPATIFSCSLATSIDALIVGISFSFMSAVSVLSSASLVGITAFLFTLIGSVVGQWFNGLLQRRAEMLGGLVLILIGANILLQHLT